MSSSLVYLNNGKFIIGVISLIFSSLTSNYFQSYNHDMDRKNNSFILRSRIFLWLRQLFLFLSIGIEIMRFQSFIFSETNNHISRNQVLGLIGSSLYIISAIYTLFQDSITNLYNSKNRKLWLIVYSLVFIYNVMEYLFLQDLSSFLSLLFSSICINFAVINSFISVEVLQVHPPPLEYTCGIFDYLTFSYLKSLILVGLQKESLQIEDVPMLVDADCAAIVWDKLKLILNSKRYFMKRNTSINNEDRYTEANVIKSLLLLVFNDWIAQAIFQLIGSISMYLSPLALERILLHVSNDGKDDDFVESLIPITITYAVVFLYVGPILKSIGDNQNYQRGRHIGVRIRSALIGLVYNKSLTVDLSSSKESIGNLNNLISVDINEIQSFCCYSHLLWSTPLEIVFASCLLFLVLGNAAWVGLLVMCLALFIGFFLGKKLKFFQEKLLKQKDSRMEIINEVLNSIKIIKYYAWENKFISKINVYRESELKSLRNYSFVNALLMIIWEILPAVVATSAFVTHTYLLGKTLTPAVGFTALTLFNLLRFPLSVFPDIINNYIRSRISLKRIISFIQTKDVKGLPQVGNSSLNDYNNLQQNGNLSMLNVTLGWNRAITEDSEEEVVKTESIIEKYCCKIFPDIYPLIVSCCKSNKPNEKETVNADSLKYKLIAADESDYNESDIIITQASPLPNLKWTSNDNDSVLLTPKVLNKIVPSQSSTKALEILARLKNIDFDGKIIIENATWKIPKGSLAVIVGITGSGKTSILQGLLGQCQHLTGITKMYGSISYVSQSAWIQNKSLRDNILFGSKYDQERYNKVIFACALESDIKLLQNGDLTEIGEKGVNLSGGQQQRVSLARAAYSSSDIILMDDPLSAVDSHVAEHIFKNLITDFLSDRTRVLVSHNLTVTVPKADLVICVDSPSESSMSNVVSCCSPADLPEVLNQSRIFGEKLSPFLESLITIIELPVVTSTNTKTDETDCITDNTLSIFKEMNKNYSYKSLSSTIKKTNSNEEISDVVKSSDSNNIVEVETKSVGDINFSVYWFYIEASGGIVILIGILLGGLWISFSWLMQNYSLGVWMEDMEYNKVDRYQRDFNIYILACVSVLVATAFRISFQIYYSLSAAKNIHNSLMKSVIEAECSWYDSTPIGRIINRFSQDISTIDSNTMTTLMYFLDCVLDTLQIVAVIGWVLPLLLVIFTPIVFFTGWVSYQYVKVSRELKRLESIKKSPVFVLFSETLQGLSTIRSFRQEKVFFEDCCKRLDEMNRCHLYLWLCNRWLNFRMQVLGAVVAGTVGLAVVIEAQNIGSALAGVVLLYSLNFCDSLTWLARTHADCQMNMNSVERIKEYSSIKSENYDGKETFKNSENKSSSLFSLFHSNQQKYTKLPSEIDSNYELNDDIELADSRIKDSDNFLTAWPTVGEIEFRNISLKYNSLPTPVLRNISFSIPARKKVGVVGRTGAGKSSLIAALFRLVEPIEGEIIIDGVNVLELPLHTLRKSISIVPQQPTLFKGSVRFNLDPFNQFTDSQIWDALETVNLANHIVNMDNNKINENLENKFLNVSERNTIDSNHKSYPSLNDKYVTEKGSNFSTGQQQLLCLARAILRKSQVLVLDECTASVDHEADKFIQETVRSKLTDCSVICIAHRLLTISFYDFVLVMEQGTVSEFDHPYSLLNQPNSTFRNMCIQSGDFDEIYQIAKNKYESVNK